MSKKLDDAVTAFMAMIRDGEMLRGRNVGKLCPVCNEEYLLQDGVRLPALSGDEGLTKEYCTQCSPKTEMVRAYLPKCWCGMTIQPRDRNCAYRGHRVCRCDSIFCPGWHDYSRLFVQK